MIISEDFIRKNEVYHLQVDDQIIGYYAFVNFEKEIYLDSLFVLPEYIGKGYGKILMNDFFRRIKNLNFQYIKLESEPFAENFYNNFGFETIDKKPSKIKDRFLPIMVKKNKNKNIDFKTNP